MLLEERIIRGGKNNCNQINQVCNIIINIKPENKTDLKNGILFALTAKSKDIIPIYINVTLDCNKIFIHLSTSYHMRINYLLYL